MQLGVDLLPLAGTFQFEVNEVKVINIEANYPSLEEARKLVLNELRIARRQGAGILKVIHGYGSSGKGGTLRVGLRKSFKLRKKEGLIREFIPGEDFTIFDSRTLAAIEAVPQLRGDSDLGATNEGVTFLVLR